MEIIVETGKGVLKGKLWQGDIFGDACQDGGVFVHVMVIFEFRFGEYTSKSVMKDYPRQFGCIFVLDTKDRCVCVRAIPSDRL